MLLLAATVFCQDSTSRKKVHGVYEEPAPECGGSACSPDGRFRFFQKRVSNILIPILTVGDPRYLCSQTEFRTERTGYFRRIIGSINRIANKLQTGTKFYHYQMLFIKPGDVIIALQDGGCERFLRDLNFIKDAVFTCHCWKAPIPVDVEVVVRDIIQLGWLCRCIRG